MSSDRTLIDHPDVPDFWRHDPAVIDKCGVCGEETEWVYLDLGHQHPDCEKYPVPEGTVWIVRGVRTVIPTEETAEWPDMEEEE